MTDQPDQGGVVRLEIEDQVATITLDSPRNRNALSRRLVAELLEQLEVAEAETEVRAVVLTHTGNTFCAGADLAEAAEFGMEEGTRSLLALLRRITSLPTPVIAVVVGHVRAGGVGLVGACDLALGSDTSTYAFSEALLGLTPAVISLTTGTRLTDRDAARKYLTGATFDGTEAARAGLLTQSVPAGAVADVLGALLAELRRVSPQGLRETKRLLNAALLRRIDDEGAAMAELSARLFASEEAREGMLAFRQRRPPRWAPGG